MNFTFTGSIKPYTLWQNATIPTAQGSPPPQIVTNGKIVPYNPDDMVIVWNTPNVGKIPTVLNSITVNELKALNIPASLFTRTFTFQITSGIQFSENTGNPNINLGAWGILPGGNRGNIFTTDIPTNNPLGTSDPAADIPYCNPTIGCPSYTIDISDSDVSINTIQAIPWNNCGAISCQNYEVDQFGMTASMTITLSVTCIAELNLPDSLDTGFCYKYCSENQPLCKQSYQDFCFTPVSGATGAIGATGTTNIFNSMGCYNFFADYIQNFGPDGQIDTLLTPICIARFPGVEKFQASTNQYEQNICACHLNPQIYTNLQTSLENKFPGSQLISEPAACLFPVCVTSPYKSQNTEKTCPVPACVNIASITNNGQVGGNNIINQGVTGCANISAPGSGNNPPSNGGGNTTPKSWWEQHWLWVILGIGLLVILIIVILIILAAEGGNKKKPK